MGEVTIISFKCANPECGKEIRMRHPGKGGIFKVTCPHCKATKSIRLKEPGATQAGAAPSVAEKASTPLPDNSAKTPIALDADFVVGRPYSVKCPHCGRQEIGFQTEKAGNRVISCPLCKGKIGFEVRKPTEVLINTEQIQHFRGKLTLLRRGWLNKDYILPEGKTSVGRYDESEKSDIAIKKDSSMSRRSIEIETKLTEKGFLFKLTVLKATNPVLVNDRPLTKGESISLNFGDTIKLGVTKFRFDKQTK
ncbi:MAG: FHA domain-containing protein [Muribaculaceae bacterium]|nr:FHA domain-containing protein [Muribaculaceae bacterium]